MRAALRPNKCMVDLSAPLRRGFLFGQATRHAGTTEHDHDNTGSSLI
jgi:hypothetical protein